MAYSDDAQTPEGGDNPGLLTITMVVVAGLVLIVGCLGIYFFVGRGRPTNTQGITVIQITKIPSATPSLTPIPTLTPVATAQEGTGGGGETVPTPDLAATAQAAPASRSVTLSEIRGSVLIKNDIVTDWTTVTTEVNIPQGTMILTNENSTVKIGFIEGTVLRLGPQTQVTLTDMSGTTVDPVTKFQLDFGRAWAVVGDAMGLGSFQIVTPLGTASVVGTFMGVEHNSNGPLDIITCLEGHCRYANISGVQDFFTAQQLESDGAGVPGAPHAMDANQFADWSLTNVPEVSTLTPTATPTGTITPTRTPSETRTPSNTLIPSQTPNAAGTGSAAGTNTAAAATGNAQATNSAGTATAASANNGGTSTAIAINQTATQNAINLTGTVFYFNATATSIAAGTANHFTATAFAFTATSFNATSSAIAATQNAIGTGTAVALTATSAFTQQATQTAQAAATTAVFNASPKFAFAGPSATVNETVGTVNFTINLSPTVNTATSVQVSPVSLSAVNGTDFNFAAQTVDFLPNQSTADVTVTITNRPATTEPDKTFQLVLSNATPLNVAFVGSPSTVTVTIKDVPAPVITFEPLSYSANEGAGNAALTVSMSQAVNTGNVTVNYSTADGPLGGNLASGGGAFVACNSQLTCVDYITATNQTVTFAPGQTTTTINIPVGDDGFSEGNETFQVMLTGTNGFGGAVLGSQSTATVTILSQSPPSVAFSSSSYTAAEGDSGAGAATITVNLSRPYANTTTVNVNYASFNGGTANVGNGDGTCDAGEDFLPAGGSLSFAPGEAQKTFDVTVCGDPMNEADETVFLSLSGQTGASLGVATATLTITNDDLPPDISVSAVNPGTTVAEPANPPNVQAVVFTLHLSQESGQDASVSYATGGGTATAGLDYTSASGTVTWLAGDVADKTVTVNVNADFVYEPTETFDFTLSSPTNATLTGANPQPISITNDAGDVAPAMNFSASPYTVNEPASGTTNKTITVNLSLASGETITVSYSTTDGNATCLGQSATAG
ncbi:MAG: FecR domain-containing protein, partial [Chloroflexi bacterium]|nr:FecR domain-containing protein [Chloroflexota bacterium]